MSGQNGRRTVADSQHCGGATRRNGRYPLCVLYLRLRIDVAGPQRRTQQDAQDSGRPDEAAPAELSGRTGDLSDLSEWLVRKIVQFDDVLKGVPVETLSARARLGEARKATIILKLV